MEDICGISEQPDQPINSSSSDFGENLFTSCQCPNFWNTSLIHPWFYQPFIAYIQAYLVE